MQAAVDSTSLALAETATHNLLGQLQAAAPNEGDVYVAIKVDPDRYHVQPDCHRSVDAAHSH
jgi:hypothetical protein